MTITKHLLKREIDHIQDQHLDAVYLVIKAFEYPSARHVRPQSPETDEQWQQFLDTFVGSCATAPLLIQDIADVLKKVTDEAMLAHLSKAADVASPQSAGPLEAYEAAQQLHDLVNEDAI